MAGIRRRQLPGDPCLERHDTLNELQGRIHDFDEFAEAVNDKDFSTAYTFIEPNYGNDLPPTAEDFTCGNSQHPLDDITRGERLIKSVYETIRNSPHWNESLLLVTMTNTAASTIMSVRHR